MNFYLSLLVPIVFGISCAGVNRMALNSTSQIMEKGAEQINREANWSMFKDAAPANIMMIESMSFADPENERFLSMLAKAYGGYAFAAHETLYLRDYLEDNASDFHKNQAISAYTKALNYGLSYFELKGVEKADVYSKNAAKDLPKLLLKQMDEDDMAAVFYTAQSLGGLINLQKNNMRLLARLGAVKSMMDWVCEQDMDFERGGCYLFYAAYEASRPVMLGGDLEKAKKIFHRLIEKYPHNLLGRVAYIQYYVIPMMDEVEYAKQREYLISEFEKWQQVKNAGKMDEGSSVYEKNPQFNLFNSIAHERFKIIDSNKDNIF